MSEPSACPDCLRRARLLAHLAPYIEKVATGAPGSRSPELLRLSNEDLADGGGAEGRRRRSWPQVDGGAGERLRADLLAAQCWACCRHDPRFPGRAARRRRRALGADRARRPGPAASGWSRRTR